LRTDAERNALVERNLNLVPWAIFKMRPRLTPFARRIGGWRDAVQIGRLGLLRAAELWEPEKSKFSNYAVIWIRWRVKNAGNSNASCLMRAKEKEVTLECDPHYFQEFWKDQVLLNTALGQLDVRCRLIVRLRYGLEDGKEYTLKEIGKVFGISANRTRQLVDKSIHKLSSECDWNRDVHRLLFDHKCRCGTWTDENIHCVICNQCGCSVCTKGKICQSCFEQTELPEWTPPENFWSNRRTHIAVAV
jgi:RNA polymerase sigma factor (sigma-70 family)